MVTFQIESGYTVLKSKLGILICDLFTIVTNINSLL